MTDLLAKAWHWLLGANNFWSAFFATVLGALAAFELERRHRRRERISSECVKGNSVIATLGRMLTVLEDLQATLPPLKDGKPTADSFRPILGIPSNLPSIAFVDLDFLLETNDPTDPCAQVHARIAHAQAQFDSAIAHFTKRNELASRYQENSLILARGVEGSGPRLQADELRHELSYFALELEQGMAARVKLFKEIIVQLRAALEKRYPGRQFLRLFPMDDVKLPAV